jgi:hypothetical protein
MHDYVSTLTPEEQQKLLSTGAAADYLRERGIKATANSVRLLLVTEEIKGYWDTNTHRWLVMREPLDQYIVQRIERRKK